MGEIVRDGIPSDADYNSTRVGVVVIVVVVVVVRIFTMGWLENALSRIYVSEAAGRLAISADFELSS